jgi:hypothetical protein
MCVKYLCLYCFRHFERQQQKELFCKRVLHVDDYDCAILSEDLFCILSSLLFLSIFLHDVMHHFNRVDGTFVATYEM